MNNISKALSLLFTIILLSSYSYVVTEPVKASWDAPAGANFTSYEVKLVLMARTTPTEYNFTTTVPSIVLQKPRGGFFDVWVRPMAGTVAGEWTKSSVEGTPNRWNIFFDIAAPGGGGIE